MNKISLQMYSLILSGILLSLLGSAKLHADVSSDTAPQLKIQLATGAKFTLGEPVILHAEITNPLAGQKLCIQTGWYEADWYTLRLVDSAGNPVAALPDTRTREARGALGPSLKIISPDSTAPLDIVATRFLPIQHPGKYFLKVHVQAPYAPEEVSAENFSQVQRQLKSGETAVVGDFVFPLTISAANPSVLQSRANALVQDILQPGSKSYYTDFDALFSMPEDAAVTSWQRLADSGNADTQARVADHLANLHTSKAADILFKMLDNSSGNGSFVSDKLSEIYNQGNPALREHIKSMATKKGIQLPEQIVIPQVMD